MAKRRRRVRPFRALVILAVAGLALVAAALLLVRFGAFDDLLLAEVSRRLEKASGLTLEADSALVDPFRLAVTLGGARLRAVEGTGAALDELTADTVHVNAHRSLILRGELRFQKIGLARPQARLSTGGPAGGPGNAARGRAPGRPEESAGARDREMQRPFGLRIDALDLEDGHIAWAGGSAAAGASLRDIGLRIRRDPGSGDHVVSFGTAGGRVDYGSWTVALDRAGLEARIGRDDLRIDNLEIAAGRSSLTAEGTVTGVPKPLRLSVQGRCVVALRDLPLPERYASAADGSLAAAFELSGTSAGLTYRADVTSRGLGLPDLGEASLSAVAEGDLRTLRLSGLDLRTAAGAVRGRLEADFAAGSLPAVELELASVDPDRIMALALPAGKAPPRIGSILDGRMSGKAVPISVRGFEGTLALSATPVPEDPRAPGREAIRPAGEITVHASGGALTLGPVRLSAAGAALEAEGTVDPSGRIDGRFAVAVTDLPRTLGSLGPLAGASPARSGRPLLPEGLSGSLAVKGDLRGRLEAPEIAASLESPDIVFRDVTASLAAEARLAKGPRGFAGRAAGRASASGLPGLGRAVLEFEAGLAPGKLDIPALKLASERGSLTGEGEIDLLGRAFRARLEGQGIDLAAFGPLLPPGAGPGGLLTIRLDGGGELARPRGTLALSIAEPRWGRIEAPSLELEGRSDGASASATLRLPEFNAGLEAGLTLAPPYAVTGKLRAEGFPLGRLLAAGPGPVSLAQTGLPIDLDGTATYPLSDPSGFAAELSFAGRDLALGLAAAPAVPGPEPAAAPVGEIAGRLRLSGDPSEPATLAGDAEITRLSVSSGPSVLSNSGPIRLRLDRGTVHVDSLTMAGPAGNTLTLMGTAALVPGPARLDGRLSADLDLAALAPFVPGIRIGGRLVSDITVAGRPSGPSFAGRAVLDGFFARPEDFPLILSGVSAEFSFDGSRLSLDKFAGTANGSPLEAGGRLEGLFAALPPSGSFSLEARNLPLNYPPGLRTTSDIALTLTGQGRDWTLAGQMRVLRGFFREDVSVGGQILGFGSYSLERSGDSETPPFLRAIDLDIAVETAEPIIIRNNMAEVGILADVRVSGNPGLPLFSGRVQNAGVGEIVFSERRFTLETARIDLLGQRVPDPNIEIVADTRVSHNLEPLDIRLRLTGPASDLRYDLTSSPPRSKEDLSLILLTGRTLAEVRGSALETLTASTIQFFSSPIASPVTRALERALSIEDVTIEPLIISAEADPGARLTLRKRLSDEVALTYSVDITSTQDQTLLLDYRIRRNFFLQAFRKDNGSYGGSLRHAIPLWLGPKPAPLDRPAGSIRPVLGSVSLEGDPKLPGKTVRRALRRVRPGRPFLYTRLSDAVDRLVKASKERGYLNADIRPAVTRSEDGATADVTIAFSPGRPTSFVFLGDRIPARARRAVRRNWTGLLPESVNLDEARTLILERLRRDGRYAAAVQASASEGKEGTVYEFTVDRGPRYTIRSFDVEGNEALSTEAIRKAASGFARPGYKGLWNLAYDRRAAVRAIERAYREIGHTEAKIGAPRIASDPAARSIDIRLPVAEGPRRTVRAVLFSGNSALDDAELRKALRIAEGGPYDPAVVAGDEGSLQALYRSRGRQQAEVRAEARPPAGEPDVDIVFAISEGPASTVSGVEIAGARRTREALIRKAVKIEEGDVFSFEALARGQKRLYDLGVFRTVNISGPDSSREDPHVPVVVEVSEEPPLTLTYAVRYNSEDKLEGQLEAALINLLGGGRRGYLSYRQSAKLRDARFSVQVPYILGLRADTRFSLSAFQERREAYVGEELSASVGQDAGILRGFELSAFYKLSRVRERAPDAAELGPASILSELSLNLIRDKRDDRFDPRRGSFLSFSVTGAPKVFGSERPYVRGFAQYSFYRPVGRGGALWASSVRFGASAFRDEPLSSRLFYAGGGTSIRGFAQDRVGPIDALTGLPTGGRFVLIVNEELRVPLFWVFRGTVFYDAGNVYSTLGDLGRLGLRHGAGIGLRAESPIGLIRLDCGLNPFRRAGEPSVVFFLSLGQAF